MSWNPNPQEPTPPPYEDPQQPYQGYQYGQHYSGGYGQYSQYGQQQQQQYRYGQWGRPGYSFTENAAIAAEANAPTSSGLPANVAAALGYLLFWLSGLIVFATEKRNRFVRFHAMQSLILFGLVTVVVLALRFIGFIPVIGALAGFLSALIQLLATLGWAALIVLTFLGRHIRLPIIGDYAERYSGPAGPGF
ncbi:MAG: hypothetical protein IMW90_14390 [Thermogemmatispora sp.]|jgi:uncharacterized membrane protein|uniref:DUF4870 domain-containing protein n=1 Tax=Thermogemmatispora aurantia TaxID=2045279 RepID=A0A5J4KCZ2_9CHLR|nr:MULTISPECIES: hypothetical protein [Thermogemmatispora]MBE3566908.1 hypothetical protein [Thermogemmatispora sp.]GER84862.1 hypothetical protein KTAU_34980 [Thermogemmatispora aurantia]